MHTPFEKTKKTAGLCSVIISSNFDGTNLFFLIKASKNHPCHIYTGKIKGYLNITTIIMHLCYSGIMI